MDKCDLPIRLTDIAERLATNDKPKSAWMDELDRAQRRGDLVILTRGGKKYGTRYTTERHLDDYLKKEYQAVNA